jgi:hypothetical protein
MNRHIELQTETRGPDIGGEHPMDQENLADIHSSPNKEEIFTVILLIFVLFNSFISLLCCHFSINFSYHLQIILLLVYSTSFFYYSYHFYHFAIPDDSTLLHNN